MTKLTLTSSEIKFQVTVKFNTLNLHPFATSSQFKHTTFPSIFVVTSLQFTFTSEPPCDHQPGSTTF